MLRHTPGGWITDKAATETEKGSKHKECTVCKYVTQTEEIPITAPEKLTITAGGSSAHQIGDGKDLTFTCSGALADLTGIYVDGKLLDEGSYTVKSGSTVLTLKASYLDTLSAGKHSLKFQYKNNASAESEFTITAKATSPTPTPNPGSPSTGDSSNAVILLILLLASGVVVVTLVVIRKRRKIR